MEACEAAWALLAWAGCCSSAPTIHTICACLRGACLTALQDSVGTLEVGKELDALLIDGRCGAAYDVFPSVTPHPLQEVRCLAGLGAAEGE